MGKKISKETKKSTEAKKKPAVEKLDIASLPELIFDNDKGCIVAEFEDGRDSVMIELNGAQFAAAVLKISNEISCCANKAQEESLRKRLEEKAKFCREKLKNSNRAYQYIRKDARQQNFEDALKQQLDDVINSLRKRKKEDSYHLGFRLGCLYGFLKSNKEIDSATELGKCLKDLQDFLEKNKIESHYSIEELGRELLYYHDKLLENKNLRLKWLNEFRKSDYFKENQNHTRVVSSVLSEARQKIKDKLEENGINISIEALLPMTTNRMKYPQEKIRFRGLNPFFEVAKGVLAIKGLQVIVSSEDWTEIKFIPKGIEELNIPEGVIRILGGVLGKCDKILGIKIPKSVSIIERGVFSRCSRLERIEVANENRAYKSKDGMLLNKEGTKLIFVLRGKKGAIQILKGVTDIGDWAFSGCIGLESITIPEGVTRIGYGAFSGCIGLTGITIPDSVTKIGENAFCRCRGLRNITIPEGVTEIDRGAFSWCTGLKSISISKNVKRIGAAVFMGCSELERIEVANENLMYKSVNGLLLNVEETELICVSRKVKGLLQIPKTVTRIGSGAFSGCTGLTSVTIPEGVTMIAWNVFKGCTGLTSITIPEGVTRIGYGAFNGCTGLTGITISSSVTKIGENAFSGCTGLISITILEGVTEIGSNAFKNCTGLKSITIPKSVIEIGCEVFDGCTSLQKIYFEGDASEELEKSFKNVYKNLQTTVYYRKGTKGWGKTFGGLPTKEIESKD